MDAGLAVDALRFKAPVIDSRNLAGTLKGGIGHVGEQLPNLYNLSGTSRPVVQLAGLGREAFGGQFSGGAQDVGVMVFAVAILAGCVDCAVCGEPVFLDDGFCEVVSQPLTLRWRQFGGQCNFKLAGDGGIFPCLGLLCCVPKFRPVGRPLRRTVRQKYFCGFDTGLAPVVVHFARALVGDFHSSAVGGGGGRRPASRPAYRFHAEVVNRHDGFRMLAVRVLDVQGPRQGQRSEHANRRFA